MSDATIHIVGLDVTIEGPEGPHRRQRCGWCGALIKDEPLGRMAWPLRPDGSDPGPPAPLEIGVLVAVQMFGDVARMVHVVTPDTWPGAAEGKPRLPEGCCALLDPEVTR